jgi:glycerophosphoryl diester phosphodiesterase
MHTRLAKIQPLAALLLLLGASGAYGSTEHLQALSAQLRPSAAPNRSVLVVAHRGCWKGAPENSLKAISDCIAMGVDVIELDVRRTADGVLVLMHDATVDRMTDGHGAVTELNYAAIRALKLRRGAGGPDAPLTEEAPPTFAAAMALARDRVLVNLDAKADVYADAFKVLKDTGTVGQIIMKRRVEPNDAALAREEPFDRVFAMPIVDQSAGSAAALLARQLRPAPPAIELIFTDLAYLDEARALIAPSGARLWVNAMKPEYAGGLTDQGALADPDATWGKLIGSGVSMLQTDEPATLLAYLRGRGRHR